MPTPPRTADAADATQAPEISVVIPCLDEETAVGAVVDQAWEGIRAARRPGEVIVVDNGSTDRSAEIAREHGAQVVEESRRGYGNAYLTGLRAARGRYIVMGDADETYPLRALPAFVDALANGSDMVIGSRLGGHIHDGAMPWLHHHVGNPLLTRMMNRFFDARISDAYCGMRAVRSDVLPRMALQSPGMEFALEMVMKAARCDLAVDEIPIEYFPRTGDSKLNSMNDGWRSIKFLLLHSPTHLFLIPGLVLLALGLPVTVTLGFGPVGFLGRSWQIHTLLAGAALSLLGAQIIQLGLFAKTFARFQLGERDDLLDRYVARVRLEHGVLLGGALTLAGLAGLVAIFIAWVRADFGALVYTYEAVLAFTIAGLGVQAVFGSFLLSILKHPAPRTGMAPGTDVDVPDGLPS